MIVFLLIGVAAGLTAWSILADAMLPGIIAFAVALVGLAAIVIAGRLGRRTRGWRSAEEPEGDVLDANQPVLDEHAEDVPVADVPVEVGTAEEPVPNPTGSVPVSVAEPEPEPAPDPAPDPEPAVVRVVPGRKRFHETGCALLAGRDSEEVTRDEAEEEGFTPCTVCRQVGTTIRKVG